MWEDDEELEESKKLIEEGQKVFRDMFWNTFSDGDGNKCLEWMVQSFCTGVVPGDDASARECAKRDGKQELIKFIIDQMQASQQGDK